MAFIKFENVSYAVSDTEILKNINLEIEEGKFVAILGANGSGKSTLAKLMCALLTPTSGRALVNDMDTSKNENSDKIHANIGIVFQNPDNQIIAATVEDDVAFGPENLNMDADEIEKNIEGALKLMDLEDKRNFAPYMLSGGQKQKVAIAGALAMNTKAIIFDEATSMLDPEARREILDKIVELNKKNNVIIIYITHFTEEILDADSVIVMEKGTVAFAGKTNEIFNEKNIDLEKLHLELPFYYLVAQKLRAAGIKISYNVHSENDLINALKILKSR